MILLLTMMMIGRYGCQSPEFARLGIRKNPKEFSKESLVIMLSPEVSTFLPPHTWKKHEHGSNILQVCNSQQFNKLNEVIESVKIFLPESLHPPDVLKEFLLHDKDYYLIDQIKSIECCSTENFIRSFICEGSLFLQTVYGKLI